MWKQTKLSKDEYECLWLNDKICQSLLLLKPLIGGD